MQTKGEMADAETIKRLRADLSYQAVLTSGPAETLDAAFREIATLRSRLEASNRVIANLKRKASGSTGYIWLEGAVLESDLTRCAQ